MEETQMSGLGRQDSSIKEQPISTVTDCRRSDNKIDSQTKSFERKQYVDGGYGWVIVLSCFLMVMIMDGLLNAFGIIYVEVIDKFGASSSQVTWILSIQICSLGFIGPLALILQTVCGTQITAILGALMIAVGTFCCAFATNIYILYVSFGLIAGAGLGMHEQIGMALVNLYFDRRRGIANGIASSGWGVGVLVFPPLTNYLFSIYGFSVTCMILGGVALLGIVAGALIITPQAALRLQAKAKNVKDSRTGHSRDNTKQRKTGVDNLAMQDVVVSKIETKITSSSTEMADHEGGTRVPQTKEKPFTARLKSTLRASCRLELFKDVNFICYLIAHGLFFGGEAIPFAFIPARALSYGISKTDSGLLVSAIGISSLIARLLFGILADLQGVRKHRFYIFFLTMFLSGVLSVVSFGPSLAAQMIFSVLYGIGTGLYCIVGSWTNGGFSSLMSLTIGDLIGVDNLMAGFCITNFLATIPALLLPAAAGFIFDATGSYDYVFTFAGSILILASLILVIIPIIRFARRGNI